jgi:hypothetical protein
MSEFDELTMKDQWAFLDAHQAELLTLPAGPLRDIVGQAMFREKLSFGEALRRATKRPELERLWAAHAARHTLRASD